MLLQTALCVLEKACGGCSLGGGGSLVTARGLNTVLGRAHNASSGWSARVDVGSAAV